MRPASRSPGRHPRTLSPGERGLDPPVAPRRPRRAARPAPTRARGGRARARPARRRRGRRAASRRARRAARRAPAASSAARRARAGGSRARPDGCCSSSGRISSRISPRTVSGVRRVGPPLEPALAAERLRLLAPDAEQRAHDAVLAPDLDPLRRRRSRRAGRGSSRPGRESVWPVARSSSPAPERVAQVAQLGLGRQPGAPARPRRRSARRTSARRRPTRRRAARGRRAAPRPRSRARASAWKRHVESAPPETRQQHGAARRDQLVPADVRLDPLEELQADSVTGARTRRSPSARNCGRGRSRARGPPTRRGCRRGTCDRDASLPAALAFTPRPYSMNIERK